MLATEWTCRLLFATNQARIDALASWLLLYNSERIYAGIGAPRQLSVTNQTAQCN